MDLNRAAMIVKTYQRENQIAILNPLKAWINECTIQGEGSYVGYKSSLGTQELLEATRRGLMYPLYLDWCHKHDIRPESHRNFTDTVIQCSPYKIEKVRKEQKGLFKRY